MVASRARAHRSSQLIVVTNRFSHAAHAFDELLADRRRRGGARPLHGRARRLRRAPRRRRGRCSAAPAAASPSLAAGRRASTPTGAPTARSPATSTAARSSSSCAQPPPRAAAAAPPPPTASRRRRARRHRRRPRSPPRRLRAAAQAPARAAPRSAARRRRAGGAADARRAHPGRHPRSARRRLPRLLDRRALGRAALREARGRSGGAARHLRARRRSARARRATPRSRAASSPTSSAASRSTGGGWAASEDADVGTYDDGSLYTWTVDEARAVLDADELAVAQPYFDLYGRGELHSDPDAQRPVHRRLARGGRARARTATSPRCARIVGRVRDKLLSARAERPQPAVDATPYAGVSARLARAYLEAEAALGVVQDRERALFALERLYAARADDGGIRPSARRRALVRWLGDHAELGLAALRAFEATAERVHLDVARATAEHLLDRFWHADGGFASHAAAAAIAPFRDGEDGPGPSANAVAGLLLARPGHAHRRVALRRARARARRRALAARVRRGHRRRRTYLLAPRRSASDNNRKCRFTPRFLKHRGITVIQKLDPAIAARAARQGRSRARRRRRRRRRLQGRRPARARRVAGPPQARRQRPPRTPSGSTSSTSSSASRPAACSPPCSRPASSPTRSSASCRAPARCTRPSSPGTSCARTSAS